MLAAITNYYNPANRFVKKHNFDKMRSGIKDTPLYVVEVAFGNDPFVLPEDEKHIQIRCKDLIWQQYRLIDLAIRSLPDRFDKAVWIDADILFEEPDWHERMEHELNSHVIVQSYQKALLLDQCGYPAETKASVVRQALQNAKKPTAKEFSGNLDLSVCYATGFSWGIRRDLVEKHGIYDRWITGSSDIALAIGIWGDWKNPFKDRMSLRMWEHYLEWAKPFHATVNGSVGCLDTTVRHLWHGHRNYKKRWSCLRDFDPATDIQVSKSGVLEWCSDKPDLHESCARMCMNYDLEFRLYL